MTPSEVAQKMADAWNTGDRATFMAVASPNIRQDVGQAAERGGQSAWAADWDAFHTAFPDSRIEVKSAVEAGDRLAVEGTFSGTHSGPGLSVPGIGDVQPTGKTVNILCGIFYRVQDDQILEENFYGLMEPLLMQLGVMPATEATAP